MRSLFCRNLGFHCDFEARGETVHEVLEKMVDHIEDNHLEEWAQLEKSLDIEEEKHLLIKNIEDDNQSPI
jgi:predicted small metal-binding protein